jgi:hypothetical protein
MFIKWRLPDNSYFYWETTNGRTYDDEYNRSKFSISKEAILNGIYMKPLKESELQAVQYLNIGEKWLEKKQYENALRDFQLAKKNDANNAFILGFINYIELMLDGHDPT